METGISDIQIIDEVKQKVEITFCVYPSCEDYIKLIVDYRTLWEITSFTKDNLSYAAHLKRQKTRNRLKQENDIKLNISR